METESSEHEGILFSLLCVPFTILFVFAVQSASIHFLISYAFAAFSLLLSGVEAVIGDESFNVGSSISAEVLKVGQKVQKWLQEPNNKTTPIRAYSGGHYSYCNVLCVYMHSPEMS